MDDSPSSVERWVSASILQSRMFGDPPPAIGRFDLIGRIGEGAAGIVWKAHDRELDRTVAIKILRRAAVGEPTHAFEEARSMARAVHPGIAAVHDVGVWRGSPYLVMEYVDGVRLGAWVEAGRPSPAAVVRVLAEVAHGLAAAHRNGLVHRDVKPDNILVRPDGAAKLLDFGVASLSQVARSDQDETSGDDDPSTVAGGGTPRYMAPEQLAGIGVDARSDQYALALTLYEALTGTLPPRLERTGAHRTESQDRGPLPARTWAAIRRALSASPDQRFHDVDAFMAAARPGARWWLVASAAAVVVLVGSGLAMYVVQPRPCEVPGIVERLVAADLPASTWPTLQTTHPEPQAQRDRIERHLRDEGQAWARLVAETCGDPKAARCLDRAALARGERLRAMDEVEEAFAPSVPRRVLALHAPAHCLRSADEPSPLGDQAEADLGAIASAREHRQLGDTQRARTIIEGVLREEPLSDEVRSRALLELGVVQANLFENTSAEASLLEVIDLAKRTGRAVHAVESMLVLASLYEQDDREAEGRGLIAAASVLAHREQDRVRWEVLLHVVLAESRYASKDGDFERALEILEGVRAEVEAAGTPEIKGHWRLSLAGIYSDSGDYRRAAQEYHLAAQVARDYFGAYEINTIMTEFNQANSLFFAGDLAPAMELVVSINERLHVRGLGDAPLSWTPRDLEATLLAYQGKIEQALERRRALFALENGNPEVAPRDLIATRVQLAAVLLLAGESGEALAVLDPIVPEPWPGQDTDPMVAMASVTHAAALRAHGNLDRAQATLASVRVWAEARPSTEAGCPLLVQLALEEARIYVAKGDSEATSLAVQRALDCPAKRWPTQAWQEEARQLLPPTP